MASNYHNGQHTEFDSLHITENLQNGDLLKMKIYFSFTEKKSGGRQFKTSMELKEAIKNQGLYHSQGQFMVQDGCWSSSYHIQIIGWDRRKDSQDVSFSTSAHCLLLFL